MLTSDLNPIRNTGPANTTPQDEPALTMELLELELSLDGFSAEGGDFIGHVRDAAASVGGIFLFDLPASGLVENCQRIAVVRIPEDGSHGMATVFACLGNDGKTIRTEKPDAKTEGLRNFAEAFVDVLQRI